MLHECLFGSFSVFRCTKISFEIVSCRVSLGNQTLVCDFNSPIGRWLVNYLWFKKACSVVVYFLLRVNRNIPTWMEYVKFGKLPSDETYAVGWSYLENGCYQLAITCNFNNRTNRWTDCHTFVSYLNDIKAWLDWLYTFVSYFRLLALILGCFTDCYVFFRMKWNQIENSSRHFPNGSVDLHDMISAVKFSLQYWTILLITGNMLKGEVCL